MKEGSIFANSLKKLSEKMKKNKKFEIAVYVGFILVGVLIYISAMNSTKIDETTADNNALTSANSSYETEQAVEERLEGILSNIRGAGNVEVMITFDTGTQIVPAMTTDTQSSTNETSDTDSMMLNESQTESVKIATVSQSGGNQAIVLTEKKPSIRGVIVIAEGAANISVRIDLQNAVKTVLGVELSQIEVFEMKSLGEE